MDFLAVAKGSTLCRYTDGDIVFYLCCRWNAGRKCVLVISDKVKLVYLLNVETVRTYSMHVSII